MNGKTPNPFYYVIVKNGKYVWSNPNGAFGFLQFTKLLKRAEKYKSKGRAKYFAKCYGSEFKTKKIYGKMETILPKVPPTTEEKLSRAHETITKLKKQLKDMRIREANLLEMIYASGKNTRKLEKRLWHFEKDAGLLDYAHGM